MDKNKIIEAATKFVQQGKYDKAIKEYEKVLALDPKDARIQQKLGEIFQKKGDNAQAADYFLKVAESYSGDGFALRAVAVYKQVLKLDEKRIDVNLKLAELYQQLGLMSDAMSQLQLVSAHYEKAGNASASLDLLKRMVELDPDNVASRIKLAELYARDNMNAEAVAEFGKAATYLKRNNRIDDYVKVAERLVFLDPNDVELSRELAQIYLTKQDTKRALAKLQICFKADPRDINTLTLLAQAFLDLGQTSKTVSVYKELAKIYGEQDNVDGERSIWEKIAQIAPDDPDAARHLQPAEVYEEPAPEPAPAPVAQPVVNAKRGTSTFKRVAEEPPPTLTPEQIAKLLTETDVYVKYGLQDKAVEHLRKIFAVDPENLDAHDKQYQIAVAGGEKAAVIEERLVKVIRLAATQGDLVRARTRLQSLLESNPGHELVPEFLATIGNAPIEEAAEVVDDSILIDSVDEAQVVEEEPAMEAASADAELVSGDEVLAAGDEGHQEVEPEMLAGDEPFTNGEGDEALLAQEHPQADLLPEDEPLVGGDEALLAAADEPLATADEQLLGNDEPLVAQADELVAEDEPLVGAGSDEFATVHGESNADDLFGSSAEPQGADADIVSADIVEESAVEGNETLTGERAFDEARDSPEFEATDEPGTNEQSLPAELKDETDFSSLDEPEDRPRSFSNDGDGATKVVNLADLARMREEIAVKAAQKAAAQGQQVNTAGELRAAPPEPEAAPHDIEEMVTLARVPVARPVSRANQPAARPPSKGQAAAKPGGRVSTAPTMMAAPRAELLEAAAPPGGEGPPGDEAPPPEVDPAAEELEEASFFIEQGVFEEAREILETVQLAYPGHQRAIELLAQLEAKEKAASAGAAPVSDSASESSGDSSFDLAQELADELGDIPTGEEAAAPLGGGDDGFQIAAEDVFAEFKKGVSKVVKPEDVDTHFDLGIAYKEMGLLNDSIGEFEQAMKGASGKPKEIDCHLMIATCKQLAGDPQGAIVAFSIGLDLPQTGPEQAKALLYDIAATYEGMGQSGKALTFYLKVAKIDPRFRDVQGQVERLQSDGAEPDPEEPPANGGQPPPNGGHVNGAKRGGGEGNGTPSSASPPHGESSSTKSTSSRKIGYV